MKTHSLFSYIITGKQINLPPLIGNLRQPLRGVNNVRYNKYLEPQRRL